MLLLSRQIGPTDLISSIKAPRNTLYSIDEICWVCHASAENRVFIFDRALEERPTDININNAQDAIAMFDGAEGTSQFTFKDPLVAKFITVGLDNANNIAGYLTIFGTLKPASKTELLWQWFTRGI